MATVPYDISTFAVGDQVSGDIIFNHLSTRTITITTIDGWVETNPSENITGTMTKNGTTVTGSSVLIETDGTVTVTFSSPLTLVSGDLLRIVLNADASLPTTKVAGVAISMTGTIETSNEDNRYDVSFYLEGLIPAGKTVAGSVIPRQINLHTTDFYVQKSVNQSATSIIFLVRKNGVQVGTITLNSNGTKFLVLNQNPLNLADGDILTIFAPGASTHIDATLADVSITIKGFLGLG